MNLLKQIALATFILLCGCNNEICVHQFKTDHENLTIQFFDRSMCDVARPVDLRIVLPNGVKSVVVAEFVECQSNFAPWNYRLLKSSRSVGLYAVVHKTNEDSLAWKPIAIIDVNGESCVFSELQPKRVNEVFSRESWNRVKQRQEE